MTSARTVKGCCPLDCQDTCAWVAHVKDGKVTRVLGARDHPITRGVLCAKVNDYQARTYASDRLLHPLRRCGPKGSGRFERIGWEEALDTVAGRFRRIIDSDGPGALMPMFYLGSMGVVQRQAPMRLFNGLGACRLHGEVCGASMSALHAEGHPVGFDAEEIADSRLIVLWGVNMLSTCHHHWQFIRQARERHAARVVCIDPRRTRTAEQCDEHIAIRPGTDAILATGMAHVMLEEGLADLEYARTTAVDFGAFREQAAAWTPERVAEACGITIETVVGLARAFATAEPAVLRAGVGPQQTIRGEAFVRSLSALAMLGGHWKRRGGGLFIFDSPDFDESAAGRNDLAPGPQRSVDLAALGTVLTDLAPPIKGLMVWCMNPAVIQVDSGRVRRGLEREDLFTVVLEHFMTDTARYADIVLPATTQLEHFDIVGAWGHQYVAVNNPAIAPRGESKSHGEIMRLLAPRLGLDHAAFRESDEQIAAASLPEGVSLEDLKREGWRKLPRPRPDPTAGPAVLRFAGDDPRPVESGALRLLTPKAHYFLNSSFANMPRQRTSQGAPYLEIHPDDALRLELEDGQQVAIRNERGEVRATLAVSDAICPGAVALVGKWWSEPIETAALTNMLTPSRWSAGGQPAYNDTFVSVEAVAASRPSEPARSAAR